MRETRRKDSADLAAHYLRLDDMPEDWLKEEPVTQTVPETAAEVPVQEETAAPPVSVPAVYHCAKPEKKKAAGGLLLSAALAPVIWRPTPSATL